MLRLWDWYWVFFNKLVKLVKGIFYVKVALWVTGFDFRNNTNETKFKECFGYIREDSIPKYAFLDKLGRL